MKRKRASTWSCIALLASLDSTRSLAIPPPPENIVAKAVRPKQQQRLYPPISLSGDWIRAKEALRSPDCCVVSIAGLESHLRILQEQWTGNPGGPAIFTADNVDLRARVRVRDTDPDLTFKDCLQVCRAVSGSPLSTSRSTSPSTVLIDTHEKAAKTTECSPDKREAAIVAALQELACGISALTEQTTHDENNNCSNNEKPARDVLLRVVRASSYKARDPMFHTDKAPLRGYVTLIGPGTEFMTRPSTPLEYMTLRSLGCLGGTKLSSQSSPADNDDKHNTAGTLRRAELLEFIVMKGDRYLYESPTAITKSTTTIDKINRKTSSWMRNIQKSLVPDRTCACVHRSPPADTTTGGERRVILSFDLVDGDDDREWYEVNKNREWRSGMTQRKSHLVA